MSLTYIPDLGSAVRLLLGDYGAERYRFLAPREKLALLNGASSQDGIREIWYSCSIRTKEHILRQIGESEYSRLSFAQKAISYFKCGFSSKSQNSYYFDLAARVVIVNERILVPYLKRYLNDEETIERRAARDRIENRNAMLDFYFSKIREVEEGLTKAGQSKKNNIQVLIEQRDIILQKFSGFIREKLISKEMTVEEIVFFKDKSLSFFSNRGKFTGSYTINIWMGSFFDEMIDLKKRWGDFPKIRAKELFGRIFSKSKEVEKVLEYIPKKIDPEKVNENVLKLASSKNEIDLQRTSAILGKSIDRRTIPAELAEMMSKNQVDFQTKGFWCKGIVAYVIWHYFLIKRSNLANLSDGQILRKIIMSQNFRSPVSVSLLQTFFRGDLQGNDTPEYFLLSDVNQTDFINFLAHLREGVYFAAITSENRNNEGHAYAIIVQDNCFYFFNPGEGLFQVGGKGAEIALYKILLQESLEINSIYGSQQMFFHFIKCNDFFSSRFFTHKSIESPWEQVHRGIMRKTASWKS